MAARETRDHVPLEFQHVYREFHAKIHRYLERLLGPTDAEDVTQEVFAKVSQAGADERLVRREMNACIDSACGGSTWTKQ